MRSAWGLRLGTAEASLARTRIVSARTPAPPNGLQCLVAVNERTGPRRNERILFLLSVGTLLLAGLVIAMVYVLR